MQKLFLLFSTCCLLTACSSHSTSHPAPSHSVGLANPASVYCQQQGGKSVIRETAQGQVGDCHLPDGRVVEEWALFRNSPSQQCQAQNAVKLVGQKNLTEDKIKMITKAGTVRILKPNQPATMDYRSDRVTVVTDSTNKVIQASCG